MVREKVKAFKEFKEYKDFFWMPEILSLAIGIDVNRRHPKYRLLLDLLAAFGVCLHAYIIWRLIKALNHYFEIGEMMEFYAVVCFLIYEIDLGCKLLGLLYHRRRLRSIYESLMQNYPMTSEERDYYVINENHAIASKPFLITSNYVSCVLIITEPLVNSLLQYALQRLTVPADRIEFKYLKPLPIEHIRDYRTPTLYVLFYAVEWVKGIFGIGSVFASDMWLISLTNQMCLHFRYISKRLQSYKPSTLNEVKDCEFLAEIIGKHQSILKIRKEMNAVFGFGLLVHLLTTTALVCTVAVQLTISDFGLYYVQYCVFLVTILCKFFAICSYGEQLNTTSTDIAVAAYTNTWYEGSQVYKKQVLILIMRAQQAVTLSAKGFQTISLVTFQLILNMSYKVFTLLQSRM